MFGMLKIYWQMSHYRDRDVTRTLIGEGGGGVHIHVLPDKFLFKSNSN